MAHADEGWRVGAIYRACVRWGMTRETAEGHMRALFTINSGARGSALNLVNIWFRRMDQRRADYLAGEWRGP